MSMSPSVNTSSEWVRGQLSEALHPYVYIRGERKLKEKALYVKSQVKLKGSGNSLTTAVIIVT